MAGDPTKQASNPFAQQRKTNPQQSAPLDQYGHEGIRGYLIRLGQPKSPRSFTSQVMATVKKGVTS